MASPDHLFDVEHSKIGEVQEVSLGQDDWPVPEEHTSLYIRSAICRETKMAAMGSSNEHLDVQLRTAVFALVKVRRFRAPTKQPNVDLCSSCGQPFIITLPQSLGLWRMGLWSCRPRTPVL